MGSGISVVRLGRRAASRRPALGAVLAVVMATAAPAVARLSSDPELRIEPDEVAAGLFYHGQTVHAVGRVPAGTEIAVEIRSQGLPVQLKRKGQIWGFLWANVGEVELDCVPSLYLMASSVPLETLEARVGPDELGVGYDALVAECKRRCSSGRPHCVEVFDDLVKLKESERLYHVDEGGVRVLPDGTGMAEFEADLFVPADAPEGTLKVRLLVFEGAGVRAVAERTLAVRQVGLAAWISSLASERGLLYGVLAVTIALCAGLLTGLVFGLGSSGGH